ncbi:MAG: UMP kinase [Lachnospiraceae bacterium]|nr:UMP kinase [Lachnospiraceae bacterium]
MAGYKRVLIKLSGEALAGEKKTGFDEATCIEVAQQIKKIVDNGTEVAIVIGGGNFWRGRTSETIDRYKADQIGILATVMNCIYVSEIFRYVGMHTSIYTPFEMSDMTEVFSKDKAVHDLSVGRVVFLAGGTGHPYFSTDTATALRAIELECDIIMMAKAIDGVYSADPKLDPTAVKYTDITMQEVVEKGLKVIDTTASALCLENKMPLLIFSLNEENSIVNNAGGEYTGTVVTVQ